MLKIFKVTGNYHSAGGAPGWAPDNEQAVALESPASLITALLNHTVNLAINHVVQLDGSSQDPSSPSSSMSGAGYPGGVDVGGVTSSSAAAASTAGLFESMQINGTAHAGTPQIPAYIRNTSMVFCIVIMCLGVIGNIMVSLSEEGGGGENFCPRTNNKMGFSFFSSQSALGPYCHHED